MFLSAPAGRHRPSRSTMSCPHAGIRSLHGRGGVSYTGSRTPFGLSRPRVASRCAARLMAIGGHRGHILSSTPGGKLVLRLFGAVAGFEGDIIREVTMAQLEASTARGRLGGDGREEAGTSLRDPCGPRGE
jgi:hypothetical protein